MPLIKIHIALQPFPSTGVLFGAAPLLAPRVPTLALLGRPDDRGRHSEPEEVSGPGATA